MRVNANMKASHLNSVTLLNMALSSEATVIDQPISPDSFLREELTGWYQVKSFYVENQYGTRFLFDTYGTRWLAFQMEF